MFFVQTFNPSTVNSRVFFPSICINFYNLVHALLVLLVSFWLPKLFSWWPLSLTVLCKENHASLTAGIFTHFSTFLVEFITWLPDFSFPLLPIFNPGDIIIHFEDSFNFWIHSFKSLFHGIRFQFIEPPFNTLSCCSDYKEHPPSVSDQDHLTFIFNHFFYLYLSLIFSSLLVCHIASFCLLLMSNSL